MSDKVPNKNSNFWKRAWWIYLFFLLLAACIVATAAKVVFVDGEHWRKLAQHQTLRYEETQATRGNIYSSDNALLAVSVPIFTVRMDLHPSVVCNDTFSQYLRPLCDSLHKMYPAVSSQSFYNSLLDARRKKKRNFLIKNKVTYSELDRMRHFPIFKKGQYRGGFVVEEKERRSRPNGILAARTIGYYNAESKTGVGLERAYNKDLQGISGHRLTQRVAHGIWRPVYSADEVKPENGKDLITTLDIRIQDVTEAALQRCMEGNEAEHGCAVVMEVKTGKVVAIANLTKQADGTYAESQNYAVGEAVEPGSIFKLASTIAILEESKDNITNRIVPTGEMKFYNRWMRDSHRGGWGDIPFSEAFEKSSNVGISYLANEIFHANQQKFVDYLYKMRLNKPLGVEIPGEGEPYIKNTKDKTWSGVSLPWMSIGYEVKVTPLQMLNLYNAVANNGKMMKPMFVSAIRKGSETVKAFEPQVLVESICSKSTLAAVQKLLQGVVESGTGTVLQNPLYKVAAKTGTAQMNYGKGQ
ncbi:MAG: penicillin-binding protein 2, partial [Bacteroidales bacterium]|nr:penicillin-binding protein 2 [Bacteroidales bacterium]